MSKLFEICLLLLAILMFVSAAETINATTTPVIAPCSVDIDAKCIKWAISKLLGLAVVSLAFLLKVPQIKNMLANANAEGLILGSLYLDLFSYACAAAYNTLIAAPLTTYAETIVISVQMAVIIALTWNYNKVSSMHRIAVVAACVAFIASIFILPQQLWPFLMVISTGASVSSRITQIIANFSQGHTGVLSIITLLMQVGGNAVRIFTTMTEVDDFAVLASYLVSFALNATIFLQIVIYWKATTQLQQSKVKIA